MHRYYCFKIDKWDRPINKKPGMPRARNQREAVEMYAETSWSDKPFAAFKVLHLNCKPSDLDGMSEEKLLEGDWDWWIYDKDLNVLTGDEVAVVVL